MIQLPGKFEYQNLTIQIFYDSDVLDDDLDPSKIRLLTEDGKDFTWLFETAEAYQHEFAPCGTRRGSANTFREVANGSV